MAIKVFRLFQYGAPSITGVWVAPGFCSIGEFRISENGPSSLKWHEQIIYSDREQLKNSLCSIVKKRWLRGKPVILSLSVPELYSAAFEYNKEKPTEEQDLLPPGVQWDDIEYSIKRAKKGNAVFTCMRHSDIDSWVDLFRSTGLIVGKMVPAGIQWSHFFNGSGDISCTLSAGTLIYNYDGKWQGSVFQPTCKSEPSGKKVSFSVSLHPSYSWCPSGLVPALEAVFSAVENPEFNLNFKNTTAEKIQKAEKIVSRSILYGAIGIAGLIGVLLLWVGIFSAWRINVGSTFQEKVSSISAIREEGKNIEAKLGSFKQILSKKSDYARILHDIGIIAKDSLWYSEISLSEGNGGVSAFIIGHSFSESAISKFLQDAEGMKGVKKAALEYTEKLSPQQAGGLTNWQIKHSLYRFKITIII